MRERMVRAMSVGRSCGCLSIYRAARWKWVARFGSASCVLGWQRLSRRADEYKDKAGFTDGPGAYVLSMLQGAPIDLELWDIQCELAFLAEAG